jgi:hypothetical protein
VRAKAGIIHRTHQRSVCRCCPPSLGLRLRTNPGFSARRVPPTRTRPTSSPSRSARPCSSIAPSPSRGWPSAWGRLLKLPPSAPPRSWSIGKAAGETSLIIWDTKGNRQFFNVTVRPPPASPRTVWNRFAANCRWSCQGSRSASLRTEQHLPPRHGQGPEQRSRPAVQIASTAGKVINLLNVEVPAADPQILLKVRFASIDRNKGIQPASTSFSSGFGNTLAGINTGQFSPPSRWAAERVVSGTHNHFQRAEPVCLLARPQPGRHARGAGVQGHR